MSASVPLWGHSSQDGSNMEISHPSYPSQLVSYYSPLGAWSPRIPAKRLARQPQPEYSSDPLHLSQRGKLSSSDKLSISEAKSLQTLAAAAAAAVATKGDLIYFCQNRTAESFIMLFCRLWTF